jgi:hypothetical protein
MSSNITTSGLDWASAVVPAGHHPDLSCDRAGVGIIAQNAHDARDAAAAGQLVGDLGERPVRDAVAIRQAAPDDYRGLPLGSFEELPKQPGLADPRRSGDRDQHAPASLAAALQAGAEHSQLGSPSHQRHVAGALETAARLVQLDHLPHPQRAALSGKLSGRMRAKANGPADQAARVRPDQDLTGGRGGLQARRCVDRVSGHHAVSRGDVAGGHLPAVDADPHRQCDPQVGAQPRVESRHPIAHLDRGP